MKGRGVGRGGGGGCLCDVWKGQEVLEGLRPISDLAVKESIFLFLFYFCMELDNFRKILFPLPIFRDIAVL